MSSASPTGNSWFLSSRLEVHDISDLYSGSDEVNDETGRDRDSQSLLLEVSYGINEKWSITGLLSAVEQNRQVGLNPETTGRGLGDGLFLVKYAPKKIDLYNRYGVSFGIGAKVPLGDDDQVDFVTLPEDMQPSTGAYSGVFWTQVSRSFDRSAKSLIYSAVSYSANGDNDRQYRFGNEFTWSIGGSYQTSQRWGVSGDLSFRETDRDKRNNSTIPNTGGKWLYFNPSVQYHFTDSFAASVSARIPVWRDVNDALQFTTSYAYSISLSYVLSKTDNKNL
jgi:hypothetical protein